MSIPQTVPAWTDEVLDFAQDLVGQARSIALRWFRHRPPVHDIESNGARRISGVELQHAPSLWKSLPTVEAPKYNEI